MNLEELYDRLLLVYLCSTFKIDIGKRIELNCDNKGRFSFPFKTLEEAVEYLENKKYLKAISENRYQVVGLRDKYIANCIRNKPRECFDNKELVRLYLEVMTQNCCVYVETLFEKMGLKFRAGDITKNTIKEGLKHFSCGQMYSFIHRAVKHADEKFENNLDRGNRDVDMPRYAIRCLGFSIKKAVENKKKIEPFNRPGYLRPQEIERFLCSILKVDGFQIKAIELVSILNKKQTYKYYCTGDSHLWAWMDFKDEVKGRLIDFDSRGSKVLFAIYEVANKIPVGIFNKYGINGKLID